MIRETRLLLKYCPLITARATRQNIDKQHKWCPPTAPNTRIENYLNTGGYQALQKALQMKPAEVIAEVKNSGLIGRGGAGFPVGLKWDFTYQAPGPEKYIVCNADEGEPGTFKDKVLLDYEPHKIIEGMIIAGYAVGASQGYIYLKGEYQDSVKIFQKALAEARGKGFLGRNSAGRFSFEIETRVGMGAYICGEETALLESIEGKHGFPRPRPPFPALQGVFDKPTVINNVETLANIPHIISNGAHWYKTLGVEGSWGTKLLSVSGRVNNPGVFEVELGRYTLKEIIYGLAGGTIGSKNIKAILPGGASTPFLTKKHLNTRVDYQSLQKAGSTLGTGALMVLTEEVNIPDFVKHLFEFYVAESCGNCVPCRIGTKRVAEMLAQITEPLDLVKWKYLYDKGGPKNIPYLEKFRRLSEVLNISKCGLGQGAANPLLSSLNYFESEYKKAIDKRQKEYERFLTKTSV